jgi:aldehyde dehydrogenase (NAD+)
MCYRVCRHEAEKIRVGDPFDEGTDMGPLVSERQYARVTDLIRVGAREATLVTGGVGTYCPHPPVMCPPQMTTGMAFPCYVMLCCVSDKPAGIEAGYYVRPTVFTQVSNDMAIAQQEVCC